MDYASAPYTTRARFFRDSPVETEIRWYEAAPNAPDLGLPSSIQNLSLTRYPWTTNPPGANQAGEVYGAPRIFTKQTSPPFLRYDHVCGTAEDFALGQVYDPLIPPVPRDANGIPICCNPPVVASGGGAGGGTAGVYPRLFPAGSYTVESLDFPILTITLFFPDYWTGSDATPVRFADLQDPNLTLGPWNMNFIQSPPGNTLYQAPASWDGNGTQVFTNVSGPGSPTAIVTRTS